MKQFLLHNFLIENYYYPSFKLLSQFYDRLSVIKETTIRSFMRATNHGNGVCYIPVTFTI